MLHKRHIKDVENSSKNKDIVVFRTQSDVSIKKTSKIIIAVYLITDFYDDKEPMKWELRTKVLQLREMLGGGYFLKNKDKDYMLKESIYILNSLIYYLELCKQMNLMSHMNFSILKTEFESLGHIIKDIFTESTTHDDIFLPEALFNEDRSIDLNKIESRENNKDVNYTKDTLVIDKGHRKVFLRNQVDNESFKSASKSFLNKGQRKESILQFVKIKGPSTIKDICSIAPDCSEKTVQRELSALISERAIRREGERRWSKYIAL